MSIGSDKGITQIITKIQEEAVKFLVLWELELSMLRPEIVKSVTQMPEYAKSLKGKLYSRYHMVGRHGGAWIYDVDSNEELERLLAVSPVYNYAQYQVIPLANMETPAEILQKS